MANAYQGQYTTDPEYAGGNPYDPETDPVQYAQWNFQHPSATQGAGAPFSGKKLGLTLAMMAAPYGLIPGVGTGGEAALSAGAGGGAAAAAPSLATSGVPISTGTAGSLSALGSPASLSGLSTASSVAAPSSAVASAPAWQGPIQQASTGGGWTGFLKSFAKEHAADLITSGVSTYLQNRALSQASQQQQQAAQRAINTQANVANQLNRQIANTGQQYGDIYRQQQQNLAPFSSLGSGAASTLGNLLGIPVNMPQPVNITPNAPPPMYNPGPMNGSGPLPTSGLPLGFGVPSMNQPSQQMQGAQQVLMKAPDGSTQQVPANLVPHYQSRGATVVQS